MHLLTALAVLAAGAPTVSAQAQVRRCTLADGGTIYTDRACKDVDAVERTAPGGGLGRATVYGGGCARRLKDLVAEVGTAIDSRDGNRLAGLYHWPGTSGRTGYAIADRLDVIAQRPLVDITPLRPAARVVVTERPGISPMLGDGGLPQAARSRAPVALRIDQTLADGMTPSRTTFGLRRHMDCWWITL